MSIRNSQARTKPSVYIPQASGFPNKVCTPFATTCCHCFVETGLTFQASSLTSTFRCSPCPHVTFTDILCSCWRYTPCRLSASGYSMHWQLTVISGDRLLHHQPEDGPYRGNKINTLSWETNMVIPVWYCWVSVLHLQLLLGRWPGEEGKCNENRQAPHISLKLSQRTSQTPSSTMLLYMSVTDMGVSHWKRITMFVIPTPLTPI